MEILFIIAQMVWKWLHLEVNAYSDQYQKKSHELVTFLNKIYKKNNHMKSNI